MFGKKKPLASSDMSVPVEISAIPTEFYGGSNPVVKFKEVMKEVDVSALNQVSASDKKLHDQQVATGSGKPLHPASLFSNRRFVIIAGIIAVLVIVVGTSAYYLIPYYRQTAVSQPVIPPSVSSSVVENPPVTSTAVIFPVNPVTSTPTTTTAVRSTKLDFPSILLGDSVDGDTDGLTDKEEADVFNTDPGVPDTDNDGYQDGHEAYYLYNPAGKEPERLIEAGFFKEYENPQWHYKIYYPSMWALGNIDNEYRDILWSTLTGENIELQTITKDPQQSFSDWFSEWAPGEKYGDLVKFETYFNVQGYNRPDYLVYYFPTTDRVYVLVYHNTPDTTVINYRTVLKTMARSFRLPPGSAGSIISDFSSSSEKGVNTAASSTISSPVTSTLVNPSPVSSSTSALVTSSSTIVSSTIRGDTKSTSSRK